ncbi:MAG: PepSY domain-containing protein [Saprospiraceae bacterium]|nr:MAG: PepSY-associated TM helix domain-containing protein [Bacteroidetes bacterium OLB9]MCO6463443.1 PepSY domain-containing protein [Saprospiraceae bacterium]
MSQSKERQKQAKVLRIFRKLHRFTGATLFIFFFVISLTGLLLGWKKHTSGIILPNTAKGTSSDLTTWLPLDSLHSLACQHLHQNVSPDLSLQLDRIDIRKDKGIVKFVFEDHFWGIQLDGVTGQLLQIERRWSDFIEKMHDGSILDFYFNTPGEVVKLVYTSVMGLALLLFTITGFWLWYGPKVMRRNASNK